jgi:hypothetical protein
LLSNSALGLRPSVVVHVHRAVGEHVLLHAADLDVSAAAVDDDDVVVIGHGRVDQAETERDAAAGVVIDDLGETSALRPPSSRRGPAPEAN